MSRSINKVILIGNVGAEPEIRSTQDGREIANFSVATSESWNDKNTGERKDKTEWHRVVVFNPGLVGVVKNYLHKGNKIYIEGALQTRKWQDNTGADKYTTEIVLQGYNSTLTLLDSKPQGEGYSNQGGNQSGFGQTSGQFNNNGQNDSNQSFQKAPIDDEIPF